MNEPILLLEKQLKHVSGIDLKNPVHVLFIGYHSTFAQVLILLLKKQKADHR